MTAIYEIGIVRAFIIKELHRRLDALEPDSADIKEALEARRLFDALALALEARGPERETKS